MTIKIARINKLCGEIKLPGDKSISHRAALLSSIAIGETVIRNFSPSDDCQESLNCMRALGTEIEQTGENVRVIGQGKYGLRPSESDLYCGNSGTTIRLISGILAGQEFQSRLTGDESLSKRPMRRIIAPLEQMNGKIASESGYPPLLIDGKVPLKGIKHELKIASAQVKSAIMFAGLYAEGITAIVNPVSFKRESISRDHSEKMLKFLGAEIEEDFIETDVGFCHVVKIIGSGELRGQEINIPADISGAAFFLIAASMLDGSDIVLKNVGLNSSRIALLNLLVEIGANIKIADRKELNFEETGEIQVIGEPQKLTNEPVVIEGDLVPNLIDEIPILAILGTQLAGGMEIRDAAELRVKESDRIKSVVENLRRMGAKVKEREDGMKIDRSDLRGAEIETFGDHRIAMAFAVAGLLAKGETTIDNPSCAGVSFPMFFTELAKASS